MRRRLEVLGAVVAVVGAAPRFSRRFRSRRLLLAGVYLAIAGAVLLVVASGRPDRSSVTRGARIVTVVAVGVALSFGLLAVHPCGPSVLMFDCRA